MSFSTNTNVVIQEAASKSALVNATMTLSAESFILNLFLEKSTAVNSFNKCSLGAI
jgi:hypothetical protein